MTRESGRLTFEYNKVIDLQCSNIAAMQDIDFKKIGNDMMETRPLIARERPDFGSDALPRFSCTTKEVRYQV